MPVDRGDRKREEKYKKQSNALSALCKVGLLAAIVRGGTSALEKYNSCMSDTCAARNSKAFA